MMSGTGRLTGTIGLRTRRLVYGEPDPRALVDELSAVTEIDLAHVVMLSECGLLKAEEAAALLREVIRLRDTDFRELWDRPAPRGAYLMYEAYLSERLGWEVGGRIHTGRSRNDLKATATAMRARNWTAALLADATRLESVLLARARRYATVVMPVYTHFQPAMPSSYGYYLTGIALALGRDLDAVARAVVDPHRCPMGAAACAGTDLPIDPARVAELLGFDGPPVHAQDTVASRDVLLRLTAAAAGLAVTLSRLATDLQLWSSAEFGMIRFPDRLVGGSSAMPQKRNAFLLEHVKAKAGHAIGAWTAAAAAAKSAPFTNSIEVGTEAVAAMWPGLSAAHDAVLLCQSLVLGAEPMDKRMVEAARNGYVTATNRANRLVSRGVPFRTAHARVGDAVRRAVAAGTTDLSGTDGMDADDLGPSEAMTALTVGGGPGDLDTAFREARRLSDIRCRKLATRQNMLREAQQRCAGAVTTVMESIDA